MIDEHDRLLKIDEVEQLSADTWWIYKSTWELITKALKWSMGATKEEIEKRIQVCYNRELKYPKLAKHWRLMIDTLKWVIEETSIDPIQSRANLGY